MNSRIRNLVREFYAEGNLIPIVGEKCIRRVEKINESIYIIRNCQLKFILSMK